MSREEEKHQRNSREAGVKQQHKLNMLDCFINCNVPFSAACSIPWKRLLHGLNPFVTLPGVPPTTCYDCTSSWFSDNISD